jgi:hypothetical protein
MRTKGSHFSRVFESCAIILALGLSLSFSLISCSTLSSQTKDQLDIRTQVVLQNLAGSEEIPLMRYLADEGRYSNSPLDAPKLAKAHQEVYTAVAFGESLKTQVALRHMDGIITAALDESTVKRLSGFLQLNLNTKKLIFNFGPEYGSLVGELTDGQFARALKKLEEVRTYYSISKEEPFQFYYKTSTNFRMNDNWTYISETGDLKTFIKNTNLTTQYQRENQKHRCATDFFWILFEMIAEGRSPETVLTP